jgi:hypothetical protein
MLRELVNARQGGSVRVDTAGLFQHINNARFEPHPDKPPPTPLTEELAGRIKSRGPITVADYMLTALQV